MRLKSRDKKSPKAFALGESLNYNPQAARKRSLLKRGLSCMASDMKKAARFARMTRSGSDLMRAAAAMKCFFDILF